MKTGRQMLSLFSGVCSCGGTIAPDDLISFDAATETVLGCRACGLEMSEDLAASLASDLPPPAYRPTARDRATKLVAVRHRALRWVELLEQGGFTAQQASRQRGLDGALEELVELEVDAKLGRAGERWWQIPSARDIELAEQAWARDEALRVKAAREEAEALAADLAEVA